MSTSTSWIEHHSGTGNSGDRSSSITGLANGNEYNFKIVAVNDFGISPETSTLTSIKPNIEAPGTLSNLTVSNIKTSQVTLSWTAPSSGGASTGYKIEYKEGSLAYQTFNSNTKSTSTTVNVTDLKTGTIHKFKVTPINYIGNGTSTESSSVTTLTQGKAQGGTVTTYTDSNGVLYKVHSFTESSSNFIVSTNLVEADLLIVGGGGGGSGYRGGGGGAGGVVVGTNQSISSGTYAVSIGAGGTGAEDGTTAASTSGTDSAFGNLYIAKGGGGGGYDGASPTTNSGLTGGCGGGNRGGGATASVSNQDPYSSTNGVTGYGNVGSINTNANIGGGGGGAGSAGILMSSASSQNVGGRGGLGVKNDFRTGSQQWYAGGGGAGDYAGGAPGGKGGGGKGANNINDANYIIPAQNGLPNTGGGGGGGGGDNTQDSSSSRKGADGGSGIVVIRYPINFGEPDNPVLSANPADSKVSLSWTEPYNGGYHITGYKIEYSTDSGFSSITAVPSSNWNFSGISRTKEITSLQNGTAHYFRIYSITSNDGGTTFLTSSASATVTATPDPFSAYSSGGNAASRPVTTYTSDGKDYKVHTFFYDSNHDTNGQTTYTFTVTGSKVMDFLIVAGGGAGGPGPFEGSGGGAGGLIYRTEQTITPNVYTLTIGSGGDKNGTSSDRQGNDSSFNGNIAKGGGHAAWLHASSQTADNTGADGGSGGGGRHKEGVGGQAVANSGDTVTQNSTTANQVGVFGNKGGDNDTNYSSQNNNGGGGGGAGSPGKNSDETISESEANSNGGIGKQYSIRDGTLVYYAGGGGGSGYKGKGTGGLGGGGDGVGGSSGVEYHGEDGEDNTGGGGGGAWGVDGSNVAYRGGNGGSGIIVIRYEV